MSDLLLRGGAVFDGRRHRGRADVLVRDGLVAAVGERLDAPSGAGVVEVDGGLVAPGFVDAHVHAVQGGLERIRCDLSALDSREGYLAAVREHLHAHPDRPWVLGGGWAMAAFPGGTPTAADLDSVVDDRPAFLPNRDHHGAWVNSAALRLAGIDRNTPDPPDGRLERDANGEPTGTLHEGAMRLVARLAPPTADAEYDAALREGQRYLHSLGVVGWQDAIVGSYAGMDDPAPTYLRAAQDGTLTADVVGALWWDRGRGDEQVADLLDRRHRYTRGRLRCTSVKIMQDGVAENGTAALIEPYLDRCGHPTGNAGHSFVDPDDLRRHVARLDAEGFQVHVHAIGDRGAREALDAFAGTDPATRAERRHHVAHLQVVHPDDVPRFADLQVAANAQALWACFDDQMVDLTLPFIGAERATWQYPFGALHRAGARLVMGSDWPVSSPDPLAAIHVAVNRRAHGEPGRAGEDPFLPEQAVDLTTAFAAYTAGSAWVNHRDAPLATTDGELAPSGLLSPGYAADLAVLDRDPFTGPVDEIGATRVVSTWVDGVAVFPA